MIFKGKNEQKFNKYEKNPMYYGWNPDDVNLAYKDVYNATSIEAMI